MRLKNKSIVPIDFSRGADFWNKEAIQGSDETVTPGQYSNSHPLQFREAPGGRFDDIVNLIYNASGELVHRGQCTPRTFNTGYYPVAGGTSLDMRLLTCPQNGNDVVLDRYGATTGSHDFFRTTDGTPFYTYASGLFNGMCALKYNGLYYLYTDSSNGTTGFTLTDTTGATRTDFNPNYAYGGGVIGMSTVFIWKDRAWGFSKGNFPIFYSKATDPSKFAVSDGGGYFLLGTRQGIREMVVYNDSLYILADNNSLWKFSYTSDPGTDGYLRQIQGPQDLAGRSPNMCVSGGGLFVTSMRNIYQVVNDNLIPIADALHLDLNLHDEIKMWDIGYGILIRTFYFGGSTKNQDLYVYHHINQAFTRLLFKLAPSDVSEKKWFLDKAQHITGQYSDYLLMVAGGTHSWSELGVSGVYGYTPVYVFQTRAGFAGDGHVDRYFTSFDGTADNVKNISIYVKLQTSPLYLGLRNVYKRFHAFLLDAWLGDREEEGGVANISPYKTTLEFVPRGMTNKVDSTMQKQDPDIDRSVGSYIIPVNQRAKAVRFTFETEDVIDYGTSYPDTFGGETPPAPIIIQRLTLVLTDRGDKSYTSDVKPSSMHADSASY